MNLEKHIESEYNRFGLIAVLILLVGCLGGITVGKTTKINACRSTYEMDL